MSATALPESGHEPERQEISLPFGLYFGAKNCPHWSTYDANDQKQREDAERKRNVEKDRRMRQLPRLHDKLHHLKAALSDVVNLDRNGLVDAAADHLERSAQAFANESAQLVADMRADAAAWRTNGQAAMEELDESRPKTKRAGDDITKVTGIVYTHGPGGVPLAVELANPSPAPGPGGAGINFNATFDAAPVPTPAQVAQQLRRNR